MTFAEPLEPRTLFAVPAGPPVYPVLDSNPNAPATLYLDVTGAPSEQWEARTVPPIPAYDPSKVTTLWETVANLYAPFAVNVTTRDPGGWDSGGVLPHNHQFRIVVGADDWLLPGYGGFSDIGSYANPDLPNTAYVFSSVFEDPAQLSRCAAHESGHAFGLRHIVDATGNFAFGYIMGQFWNDGAAWGVGTNDLGQTQDDNAVLTSALGSNPGYVPGDRLAFPGVAGQTHTRRHHGHRAATVAGNSQSTKVGASVGARGNWLADPRVFGGQSMSVIVSDNFVDTAGTSVTAHTPGLGGAITETA